ncbi:mannose/fructose/sorbose PTS transporter subunit IIA [Entomohabitans teleogrylli]|uniref:mannose/fructose/sorbose PTS transporter subunit IIA n=1 Tax=Entomohabitans teleogrylli TaxID=1384589 RepID=UPI00073D9903|nr:mannose/fructose/sorbose PTS transporter subunit IIA [Entomohabitans teleogrylli]
MVSAIFCAHGHLARAMLDSVNMVYGATPWVSAVTFQPGEDACDIADKLTAIMADVPDGEWLIAVDMQFGSPWNAAVALAMTNPRLQVISGLSLPLALELVDNQQTLEAPALCAHLSEVSQQCCAVWQPSPQLAEEEDF